MPAGVGPNDTNMADSGRSEDVYGEKVDRCIYNGIVKLVGGVGVGIVFSALLLKRKPWPLILGGGVGAGMALSDCNHEFRTGIPHPHSAYLQRKLNGEKPRNMRNEFLAEAPEHIQPSGENVSDSKNSVAKEEAACNCKPGTSCLCKKEPKIAKSVKSAMNKPFPCLSDNFERRNSEGE